LIAISVLVNHRMRDEKRRRDSQSLGRGSQADCQV
jgi:hypothetical protein